MPVTSRIDPSTNTLTIFISGNFDFSAHPDFRKAYQQNNKASKVVVDLKQTEYMDSAALGMLLLLDENYPNNKIKIVNANEYVKQILEIANFHRKFDIS